MAEEQKSNSGLILTIIIVVVVVIGGYLLLTAKKSVAPTNDMASSTGATTTKTTSTSGGGQATSGNLGRIRASQVVVAGNTYNLNNISSTSVVFGDLTGDTGAEAVVLFSYAGGGTDIFRHLVVLTDVGSKPVQVATVALGNRVSVKSFHISGKQIVITRSVEGCGTACTADQYYTTRYQFSSGKLVEVK